MAGVPPSAREVLPVVFSVLVAIVVFGALLLTMSTTFNDIALGCQNTTSGDPQQCGQDPANETEVFSSGARGLAAIGPLLLIVGLIALPIGMAVWLFTRFV